MKCVVSKEKVKRLICLKICFTVCRYVTIYGFQFLFRWNHLKVCYRFIIKWRCNLSVFTLINPVSLWSPIFLKTHCFQLRPKDPGAPVGPGGPWLPRAPASPLFPGVPAGPEGPLGPLGPWGPWLPREPAFPGGPGRPCLPRTPSSPLFPRGPMGPSGPWLPGDPVAPIGPADPGLPGIPGIPGAQKQAVWPQDQYGDVCWVPWTV